MPRRAHQVLTTKDIMRKPVLTVDPRMTVQEVTQLFLDRQITGAPVVDEDDKLVGVISQTDLLRYQRREISAKAQTPSYYHESDGEVLVSYLRREVPESTQVRDIMTPATFMTDEDTPVGAVARFMLKRRVHRIIVTRDGKLAGIVTSMDLLRALLRQRIPRHTGTREARRRVAKRISRPQCLHG